MENYLNIEAGLEKVENKKEAYIEILKSYCKESTKIKRILKEAADKNDYENYRIKVHALKSISLSIGAAKLSEFAKKLEHAAINGEYEFIKNNNHIFLEDYEAVLRQAEDFLSKEVINIQSHDYEQKKVSREEIKKDIENALKYINEFEIDLAVKTLKRIEFIKEISECIELIDDFEYEQAKEILGNFLVE